MTYEELNDLPFIPRYLGYPMYPGGFPLSKDRISYNDKTVREIELAYYQQTIREDELTFLKEFVIYHIFAPVFYNDFTKELWDKINPKMSLDRILDLALEYGLDPL
jgi:hypothetical protein